MSTELKVVMFTDQIGSTSASEKRTPAEKRRVSEEQSALTAEAAGLCRGKIVADTGDGHMLLFDACGNAVLCGHLIQQRVQERNAGLTEPDLRFDLHIGIDFGEATLLSDGNQRSDAASRAARVCSECPTGEVYFTHKVAQELHPKEAETAHIGDFDLKGVTGKLTVYRLMSWRGSLPHAANPFVWRDGIREANAFFDRGQEQRRLKDGLSKRQNMQIVGERRIGKTSLLLQIVRQAPQWQPDTMLAYMDMQHPACFTLNGFLRRSGQAFGCFPLPDSLTAFAEHIEILCRDGKRPVLCIDEFEEYTMRRDEFRRDFFLTLRACSQRGMAVITASRQPLNRLTDPQDPTSPFYNTFQFLPLTVFSEQDAADFLTVFRSGVSAFLPEEKTRILDFARCHPLVLQVACYYVIEAKERGEQLSDKQIASALQRANEEMRVLLPSW